MQSRPGINHTGLQCTGVNSLLLPVCQVYCAKQVLFLATSTCQSVCPN